MSPEVVRLADVITELRRLGFVASRIELHDSGLTVEISPAAIEPEKIKEKPEPDRRLRALGVHDLEDVDAG